MTNKVYTRLELATNQLEAAIGLFVAGRDRFSVITLAGAADVILSRLVINTGRENFTESVLLSEVAQGGTDLTREGVGKEINDTLSINHLKHMDDDDDGYIDIDLEECALAAILKALANYVTLAGRNDAFVQAFLYWVKLNLDPNKYNVDCDPNWEPPSGEA
ncbi:MAG: hypothetical protein A2076_03195 [Geobacteraceae bacterium GWC2_53_11]|nr:MAG: hypothetical protein A2076_03195 [Geobacteraceae bacterium GWC2_53_11]